MPFDRYILLAASSTGDLSGARSPWEWEISGLELQSKFVLQIAPKPSRLQNSNRCHRMVAVRQPIGNEHRFILIGLPTTPCLNKKQSKLFLL